MKNKIFGTLMVSALVISMLAGCGNESAGNGETASTADIQEAGTEVTSERDFSPERLKAFAELKGLDYAEDEDSDIGNPDITMKIYSASNKEATISASVAEVPAGYKDYLESGDSGMSIQYEDSVTDAESYLAFGGAMLTVFSEKASYVDQSASESAVTQDIVDAMNPIYALMNDDDGTESYMLMAADGSYMLNLGVTVNNFSEFAEDAAFFGLTVSEDDLKEVPEYDWGDMSFGEEITFSGEGMSDEEIAEAIFEQDALSEYEVEDYEIKSVEIMEDADRESLISEFYPEAGDGDIFAVIRYDVKPYEDFYEDWTAGNGEEDGEWIRNKDACVYIEHTDNGYSMSSYGTGW